MKNSVALLLALSFVSLSSFAQDVSSFTTHETDHYELVIPEKKHTGILILFAGFPETPDVTKQEFKIIEPATEAGLAVALMRLNRKL